jgi:hypothetical protein
MSRAFRTSSGTLDAPHVPWYAHGAAGGFPPPRVTGPRA